MATIVQVPPPPTKEPPTGEKDFIQTWKNWFSVLWSVLERQGLISAPAGHADSPNGIYWNKITDPAWAHMAFLDFATPKVVTNGQPATNYDSDVVDPWQLVTDPVAGTITISSDDAYPQTGLYMLSVSGFIEGTQNTNYVVTLYADGVPTPAKMPVILKGNATNVPIAWSGLVAITTSAVLDLRLETGASLSFYTLNWSMYRISPVAGEI